MTWWKTTRAPTPRFTEWSIPFICTLRGTVAERYVTIVQRSHDDPEPEPHEHLDAALKHHKLSLTVVETLEARALLSLEVFLTPGELPPPQGPLRMPWMDLLGPWKRLPCVADPVPCHQVFGDSEGYWHSATEGGGAGCALDASYGPVVVCLPTCLPCVRSLQRLEESSW